MIHFTLDKQNSGGPIRIFAEDKDNRVWIARAEGIMVLKVEPVSQVSKSDQFSEQRVVLKSGKERHRSTNRAEANGRGVARKRRSISHSGRDCFRRNYHHR